MDPTHIVHADGHVGPITTLEQAKRAAFLGVWRGLQSQGFRRSTKERNDIVQCAYRGDDGLKCAAGWLIPDSEYTPNIEGCGAYFLDGFRFAAPLRGWLDNSGNPGTKLGAFISELQHVHDISSDAGGVESRLREFARNHGYPTPEPS